MAILNSKIIIPVLSLALLAFSAVHAEDQGGLPPPSFVNPEDFYPIEEVLYLEGKADPNALVTVVLQKSGVNPLELTAQALSSGEWSMAKRVVLETGNYEVRVRQQLGDIISGWSEPQLIKSVVTGINIFGWNILYSAIVIVLLLVFVPISILFIYFGHKYWKLRRWLKKL